jgi:exonuclease III
MDPLGAFFYDFFKRHQLIDIEPVVLSPTWRNRQSGCDAMGKRLDMFLFSEVLVGSLSKYCSWTINSMLSDHNPIVLQLCVKEDLVRYPFKFNSSWLEDLDFIQLVKDD